MICGIRLLFVAVGLFIAGAAIVLERPKRNYTGEEEEAKEGGGLVPILGVCSATCFLVGLCCPNASPRSDHVVGDL